MDVEIPNEKLTLSDIPPPDGEWESISDFAHTFDGYERWGSFDACAAVANSGREDTLDELRTALFFLVRGVRHAGFGPSDQELRHARHLVRLLRERVSDYTIPIERFDAISFIEARVQAANEQHQGALRTALSYLYLSFGPVNLPRDRLRTAEAYLEPRERVLIRWLYTRTNGSERKRYGTRSLVQARGCRYRCESCGYSDVRAIELDHVEGRVAGTGFACLCANCHTIKSRAKDWSGERRYAQKPPA